MGKGIRELQKRLDLNNGSLYTVRVEMKGLWSGLKCTDISRPSREIRNILKMRVSEKNSTRIRNTGSQTPRAVTVAVGVSGHKNKFQ